MTGLPLIFADEIEQLYEPPHRSEFVSLEDPRIDLGKLAGAALVTRPGEEIASIVLNQDDGDVRIWTAPPSRAGEPKNRARHFVRLEPLTGEVIGSPGAALPKPIQILLRLHIDLFGGLAGELFMGLMAMLLIVAIVSGTVIYGPFTRKLPFGTVRNDRTRRIRWLDLHNLLSIATFAWAFVIAVTGVMNELSTPLFAVWQKTDIRALMQNRESSGTANRFRAVSPQIAATVARAARPSMTIISIVYPGQPAGTPYDYMVWLKGDSAVTSRLFSPVLVDAKTGQLVASLDMPWYLRALQVSRPLHFGDYGGLPLKIIWALFDVVTIVVLGSGLYLWLARHRQDRAPLMLGPAE